MNEYLKVTYLKAVSYGLTVGVGQYVSPENGMDLSVTLDLIFSCRPLQGCVYTFLLVRLQSLV